MTDGTIEKVDPQQVVEPIKWLGETVGFWVQNLILAVSAIAAIWVVRISKVRETRRATIDLIIAQSRDAPLDGARHVLVRMHEAGEKNLAKHLENKASEEYKAILLILNTYEFVSSGIRDGAFNESTYKRIRYSTLVKDWEALCAFVFEFRRVHGRSSLFQDFQWLADRWQKHPLKADHESTPI